MDDMEDSDVRTNKSYFDRNLISEGFNSISKMQNQELILKQMNPVSMNNQSSMYKVNLAAALHDHISCTKLQPDLCRSDDGLFTLNFNSTSRQQQQQQKNLLDNETDEFTNFGDRIEQEDTFKDIILVQLDLIQHQQEQLLKKERQLQSARQDCESLYKRVDSMEKEIQSLKDQLSKKNENSYLALNKDSNDQLTFSNFLTDPSNLLNTTPTSSSTVYQSSDQFHFNKSPIQSPKLNESADEPVSQSDKKVEETSKKRKKTTSDNNEIKEDKKVINVRKKKASSATKKPSVSGRGGGKKTTNSDKHKDGSKPNTNFTVNNEHSPVQLPIRTIETEDPYEIVTNNDFFNSLDDEANPAEQSKFSQQSNNIDVPSWRVNPISCSYSLEGTECLHDDVFYRRHSKLELDEKRRKKWDQQRLRQQLNNERLRGRYSSKIVKNVNSSTSSQVANNDNSDDASGSISSFYPPPNYLKYIEITDKLPVVAFGFAIPEIEAKNLTLPWNSTMNNNNSSKKSSKSGKVL